uniref:hypothetical protein n=1 Tax=Algoriphagus sp. TaxID=1872435 RepID=UPI0040488E07
MITVVSHDAGGAEILSSWLLRQNEAFCLVLDGPAKEIFKRKLGKRENFSLGEAVKKGTWVLCGTSWQSDLERKAIVLAKEDNKKTVAFLDHWVNYIDRFQDKGMLFLPDEIWVGDMEAKKLAENIFSSTPIILHANPYFEDLKLAFENMPPKNFKKQGVSILYVCEPTSEHALLQYGDERHWGYTEKEALNYFLSNLSVLNDQILEIKIRPHPSEKKDKYDWARTTGVVIGGDKSLLEEIVASDIVVGGESMAMVIGIIAGKRVISCVPPGGIKCRLPHTTIEYFEKLISDQTHHLNA